MDDRRFTKFTISISKLNKLVQKLKTTGMKKYGLKGAHVSCLYILDGKKEGLLFSEICKACDLDRALVSRTLSELQNKGYVMKQADDCVYYARYLLTQKAEEILPDIMGIIETAKEKGSMGISEKDLKIFYQVLDKFIMNLEGMKLDE